LNWGDKKFLERRSGVNCEWAEFMLTKSNGLVFLQQDSLKRFLTGPEQQGKKYLDNL